MITYYATSPHGYTFTKFVDDWAPDLAGSTRVVGYSTIDLAASPAPGLHVLTDFERLLAPERALVRRLHDRLARRDDVRVIGDPRAWLGRHALLARLHAEGINDFRAWTLDELGEQVRYPVFLRWANNHDGTLGRPVHDAAELARRLRRIERRQPRRWRWIRDQLLVVEKIDARSPDGLFRKYSVARIGDAFVPRHVEVSRKWVTKMPDVVTPATVAEEEAFLADPPDLDLVRRVFDLAGIAFGRIDWGYADGRLQVWEINTNPMLAPYRAPHPLRAPGQVRQTALTRDALLAQVPEPVAPRSRRALAAAPERWAWAAVNAGSRRWDPRRR